MKYFLLPLLCAGIIAFLSLVSVSNLPKVSVSNIDKVAHFGVYFILTITLIWAVIKINKNKSLSFTTLLIIFASCVVYGVTIEILQYLMTTGRSFEIPDIVANIAGCIFGVLLYKSINTSVHEF